MATETNHQHLGFRVELDHLAHRGSIIVHPDDWLPLRKNADALHGKLYDAVSASFKLKADLDQAKAENVKLKADLEQAKAKPEVKPDGK